MNLHKYNIVIINSSGGKDSLCAIWEVCRIAEKQNYPLDKIVVSHQDLGDMEWAGTKELISRQATFFGLKTVYSRRRDKNGHKETLLDYVERRGKWPSSQQRYCTSDFKRGPGARVVTALTRDLGRCSVLYVFGFRKEESASRSKKTWFSLNKRLTTKKRTCYDWLPIHDWTLDQVWDTIKSNKLPYHKAYDLGMPRLSCCFCIFSPFDALVLSGYENPELLERYVEVEGRINHSFKHNMTISSVRDAIRSGYRPDVIEDWTM